LPKYFPRGLLASTSSLLSPESVEPYEETADVWTSIAFLLEGIEQVGKKSNSAAAQVIGRLKPGVRLEQAQADLSAIQGEPYWRKNPFSARPWITRRCMRRRSALST
jgi:hypothetical protein